MPTTTELAAASLGLHRSGREWRGTCPLCEYSGALVLGIGRGGAPLLWCASCDDRDGLRALLRDHGAIPVAADPPAAKERNTKQTERSKELALRLWRGSRPATGTLADRYLTARGLAGLAQSPALRFCGDCWHRETHSSHPAMIALITDANNQPLGIHRTFLAPDGSGKAAIEPARKSLGTVWGGAIRLAASAPHVVPFEIVVGEGLESSASAGRLLNQVPWAAISAGNLGRGLALPFEVRAVVIAADADERGRKAANKAWHRWTAEGRKVRVGTPDKPGSDFNDLLRERVR